LQTNQTQKPFTPTTLKSLHQQTNSPTHKLLQKLYINFVLTSEIIDHTIPKSITFDQEGFWVGNRDIIDFDRYAFLRFEGDRAFYVDAKEEFWHRKSEANHQLYYSPTKGGWFALLDNPKIENIDLDELYFNKTKREAYNIRYISIDPTEKEPCFRPKRRNLNIEELKKKGELFGVKYRYNQIEGLVCYLDTKGNLRLVDAPRDRQIEELSSLGLKLKKRSLILYTNTNKKATKNDIRDFNSTTPYQNRLYYQDKKIKVKEVFYLNQTILCDKIDKKSGIYFIDSKEIEIYLFKSVHIIYTNKKGEKRYILYKFKQKSKKKSTYLYEKNSKGIVDINQQNLIPKEYSHKIVSYSTQVYNTTYELLFLSTPQEHIITLHQDRSVHYRRSLIIGEIKIDIFPQLKNIRDLNAKRNYVLMVDLEDSKFANTYGKVLYRFRNSIAHAEFEIGEEEIRFSNTNHDKILFKARIEHEKMEGFTKQLLEGVWGE